MSMFFLRKNEEPENYKFVVSETHLFIFDS